MVCGALFKSFCSWYQVISSKDTYDALSKQFDAGNLGNSGQEKQVFWQLRHEKKVKRRLDKDPIQSIQMLISKFQDDLLCETFQDETISH